MEILYLTDARRIALNIGAVVRAMEESDNYLFYPVDASVVLAAAEIDDIRELHDRVIAGTAKHLDLPVLTSDQILAKSRHITTIW